jgi:ubiquinone/menaquinone biosynthesis C-methylase UbiE
MDAEAQRLSFGETATTYQEYRPSWPAETAAWLTGTEPGGPAEGRALDVLDLGAGTGKLTETLVAAGHRVTAVDPSEGMLAVLQGRLPQVQTEVAAAEVLPFPDDSFDVVTVAQAWHWVDQPVAAAECARVLRPGGHLAVAWHLRDPSVAWFDELMLLVGEPDYQNQESIRIRTTLEIPPPFGPTEKTTFEYGLRLTPEGLAKVTSTWSYVAVRPDREQVLTEVELLGHRVADADGTLVLPHITYCYRAAR